VELQAVLSIKEEEVVMPHIPPQLVRLPLMVATVSSPSVPWLLVMDQYPFATNAHPTNKTELAVNQNSSGQVVV